MGPERQLEGVLEVESSAVQVRLSAASRISLHVSFEPHAPPPDRTVFPRLQVQLPDRMVELSSCRFHVEYTRRGFNGLLVFLDDVYDCRALCQEQRFVNLSGFFQNLPLVLAQKDAIRQEFRDYVSHALYDLSVYKRFFDEQDRILANETAEVAEAAQKALLETEGRRFFAFFDRQLAQLEEVVRDYDRPAHEAHGFYLRRQAWHFILGSEFLKRTNLKPRGYAGDAEMMRMVYANAWSGRFIFNKLMHKHPIETPAAQAVRNRRRLVARTAQRVAARFPSGELKLFSVAAGPASELEDIFHESPDPGRLTVSLLDQDLEAIAEAKIGIARIEQTHGIKVRTRFHNDSVRTMLRGASLGERFGRHHLIYSMGLFDYLTPPVARVLLSHLYGLLEPGGTLIVGNYHDKNPTRVYMSYWMDWPLFYRSEGDLLGLAEGLPGSDATVGFDESRAQMFLEVHRTA